MVAEYIKKLGVYPAPPYSRLAQRHESGIHVNYLLRDRKSYGIFPHGEWEIWFGKCSGASNFQYLFEKQLQKPLPREQDEKMRSQIKCLTIQEERSFSTEEV